MGKPINLEDNELKLRDSLQDDAANYWAILNGEGVPYDGEALKNICKKMAVTAHELHMSLKNRGIEPIHHAYMIKNRGCQPEELEFYRHIHPVEDLLSFIKDSNANDDPSDKTLGAEFKMKIYVRRLGWEDTYRIKRTESGWYVEFLSISGDCDKKGSPYLFMNLDHDGVCYPAQLGDFMEWLWEKAAEKGMEESEVQTAINKLGVWISVCEKKAPKGIFQGLI